jgi:lactoylglutathione lyase
MRIEHIALWVNDIEKMRKFYCSFFQAQSSEKYFNPHKNFSSYFLSFKDGTRLEIMSKPGLETPCESMTAGWAHIAFSAGSKDAVDNLTDRLRSEGYTVAGEPRTTGDGYYESVILDPEGNQIEITI